MQIQLFFLQTAKPLWTESIFFNAKAAVAIRISTVSSLDAGKEISPKFACQYCGQAGTGHSTGRADERRRGNKEDPRSRFHRWMATQKAFTNNLLNNRVEFFLGLHTWVMARLTKQQSFSGLKTTFLRNFCCPRVCECVRLDIWSFQWSSNSFFLSGSRSRA